MGRSQVERNRTHGRPGTKGRGTSRPNNNNRTSNNRKNQKQTDSLGSNAFRYEKRTAFSSDESNNIDMDDGQAENDVSFMMEHLSSGNEFGLSHYSVASDLLYQQKGGSDEVANDFTADGNTAIDVKSLSKIMEKDNDFHYLRFDPRMKDLFLKRFGGSTDELMTVSESRLCGKQDEAIVLSEKVDTDSEQNQDADAEEGEDLEGWLDDMIGS